LAVAALKYLTSLSHWKGSRDSAFTRALVSACKAAAEKAGTAAAAAEEEE
jgi:hypothetical protein